MRVKNAKVKLIIPIPINKPDENGVVYTKEAVENAVTNLRSNLPILYGNDVIGVTTGSSHIVTWDYDNQICKLIVDGVAFYSGAEITVNEVKDGKVSSFEIASISLTK